MWSLSFVQGTILILTPVPSNEAKFYVHRSLLAVCNSSQMQPRLSRTGQPSLHLPRGESKEQTTLTQEITNSLSGAGLTGTSAHSVSESAITFLIITGSSSGNTRSVVQGHTAAMLALKQAKSSEHLRSTPTPRRSSTCIAVTQAESRESRHSKY